MRHLNDETKLKIDKGKKNKEKDQQTLKVRQTSQMKIYKKLSCQLIALKNSITRQKEKKDMWFIRNIYLSEPKSWN